MIKELHRVDIMDARQRLLTRGMSCETGRCCQRDPARPPREWANLEWTDLTKNPRNRLARGDGEGPAEGIGDLGGRVDPDADMVAAMSSGLTGSVAG